MDMRDVTIIWYAIIAVAVIGLLVMALCRRKRKTPVASPLAVADIEDASCRLTAFLARYAARMLGCGATCMRISKNMNRMAALLDKDVDMIILPSHIEVCLTDRKNGHVDQQSVPIEHIPVSYMVNAELSRLSWKVAEGRMTLRQAEEVFDRLPGCRPYSVWVVMALVVVANASFCRLFGGDPAAMAIVGAATALGYSWKNMLLRSGADFRVIVLLCSFISAVVGMAGYVFNITATPDVALGTSVLFLIPGIPYINSVSDLIDGHYLCALSRFLHAVILTCCIALGLTAAYLLMNIQPL